MIADAVHEADWRALGTGVRLVVAGGHLDAARSAVERVLDEVDRAYSRFRSDSELMAVNAAAGTETRLSPLLSRAIAGALRAAQRSGGAVDPTIGRAMRLLGYDVDFSLLAGSSRPIELRARAVPGWTAVRHDPRSHTLRMPRGVELDLGSTGKGLAADLAARAALDAAVAAGGVDPGILVGLGGDIATAGRAPEGGWEILVVEDSATPPDAPGEVVSIDGGAIATSTTTVRRWTAGDGVTVHHIVDPRTGLPADTPWRTATVVAATCEEANGASTAAIVLGEAAPGWLASAGLPARLVARDGEILRVAGWPDPEPGGADVEPAPAEA